MVSQTGPRVVRSTSCKGLVYPGKGPNKNFGANKCYLGQNFLNLAPKGPTWQPWPRHLAVLTMPDSALYLCAARLYHFYDVTKP